jgi:hypothetical protein
MVWQPTKSEALPMKIEQFMQRLRRSVVEHLPLGDRGASWAELRTEAA